jgi:hypothetical protein
LKPTPKMTAFDARIGWLSIRKLDSAPPLNPEVVAIPFKNGGLSPASMKGSPFIWRTLPVTLVRTGYDYLNDPLA